MPKMVDYSDRRVGKLQVIRKYGYDDHGRITWLCCCDCGRELIIPGYRLKTQQGCMSCRKNNTRHNLCYTRLHNIWTKMKQRCYNPKNNRYHRYGGRGIIVCDEWKEDFKTFYEWAITHGYRDDLTIERVNNDGNYEPTNCTWIPRSEQAKNMSHPKRGKYNKRSYDS